MHDGVNLLSQCKYDCHTGTMASPGNCQYQIEHSLLNTNLYVLQEELSQKTRSHRHTDDKTGTHAFQPMIICSRHVALSWKRISDAAIKPAVEAGAANTSSGERMATSAA